jgi:hypothetical protein
MLAKNDSWMDTRIMAVLKKKHEAERPMLIDVIRETLEKDQDILKIINILKEEHPRFKEEFLNKKPLGLSKDRDKLMDLFLHLSYHYAALFLFPDAEIKLQFRAWGLPLQKLKWMIPFQDILRGIEKIQNEKIIVDKTQVFLLSLLHLKRKIAFEVFQWLQSIAGKTKFDLRKELLVLLRRYEHGGKLQQKNSGDIFIWVILEEIKTFDRELSVKKAFINHFDGNTGSQLRKILSCNFQIQEISQRQYLLSMYDFFKLICKDKNLLTENEFSILCQERVNQKLDPPFDGDFDTYRYQKLKSLIPRK